MPTTYLSHPVRGGVHIAYDDDEVKRCEADGWVSYGSVHPADGGAPQAAIPVQHTSGVEEVPRMPDEPASWLKKRGPGRPRKSK